MPHSTPLFSGTSNISKGHLGSFPTRAFPAAHDFFQSLHVLGSPSTTQPRHSRALHCSARSSSSGRSSGPGDASSSAGHASRAAGGRRGNAWKSGLLSIKGVGPRYENLLMQRGLTCVEKLQDQLHLNFSGDKSRLQKYLQVRTAPTLPLQHLLEVSPSAAPGHRMRCAWVVLLGTACLGGPPSWRTRNAGGPGCGGTRHL